MIHKPVRVNIRLKNNVLVSLREAAGLNATQLAEKAQVPYSVYIELESLRGSPIGKNNKWTKTALKLSEYWKLLPEDLFPDLLFRIKNTKGSFSVDEEGVERILKMNKNTLPLLPEEIPDRVIEIREAERDFSLIMQRVEAHYVFRSPKFHRNVEMLKMHYGIGGYAPSTFDELAEHYGISREQVRQVVIKLERKIRHEVKQMRKEEEKKNG